MTTHDALLAAVLANPADDLPRLVYADWLDEHAGEVACAGCGGKGSRLVADGPYGYDRSTVVCDRCSGAGRVSDGRPERAAHIRWACANPQNSSVCLCLTGRRQPQPCETCRMMGDEIAGIPRRTDGETHYVLNRGFVSEIRCRLADWCGGECRRCDGSGGRRVDRPDVCSACSGTGRTPGVGPRLVREHPVERVVVTDIIQTRVEHRGYGRAPITWHRVARDQAGQLENFFVLFQRSDREFAQHIETASLPMLQKFVSAAAIAWAKAQPPHVSTTPVSADVTR